VGDFGIDEGKSPGRAKTKREVSRPKNSKHSALFVRRLGPLLFTSPLVAFGYGDWG
jgi:hypothetical protein